MRLSVDDGCASDVQLAQMVDKYEIPAVFYWPVEWRSLAYEKGYQPLSFVDALIISQRSEVGSHTVTHRHLTNLPLEEAKREIADAKLILARMFQQEINKFCPPRGYTTPELTEYTLKLYKTQRLTKGPGLVHIHPNSGANGNRPWRDCITEETEELWCHSWELDKFNLWGELEGVLRELARS